jgi:hypothetical protein
MTLFHVRMRFEEIVVEAEAHIDVVDRWPDLGTVFFSERDHITCVMSG